MASCTYSQGSSLYSTSPEIHGSVKAFKFMRHKQNPFLKRKHLPYYNSSDFLMVNFSVNNVLVKFCLGVLDITY